MPPIPLLKNSDWCGELEIRIRSQQTKGNFKGSSLKRMRMGCCRMWMVRGKRSKTPRPGGTRRAKRSPSAWNMNIYMKRKLTSLCFFIVFFLREMTHERWERARTRGALPSFSLAAISRQNSMMLLICGRTIATSVSISSSKISNASQACSFKDESEWQRFKMTYDWKKEWQSDKDWRMTEKEWQSLTKIVICTINWHNDNDQEFGAQKPTKIRLFL